MCGLQQLWCTGLVAPRHVGSSRTRAQTRIPCIGRQILNHCTTREVAIQAFYYFLNYLIYCVCVYKYTYIFLAFFFEFLNFIYFLYSRFLLVIHLIRISLYMSILISQFITPPPPYHFPPLVSIRLFCTSVFLFLPCKLVHLYHFSRFHIYVLIYDICFSLSDSLHSV